VKAYIAVVAVTTVVSFGIAAVSLGDLPPDVPRAAAVVGFVGTLAAMFLLAWGVWRGSRLAWILSLGLLLLGLAFGLSRPLEVGYLNAAFNALTTAAQLVLLAHPMTRSWCRVRF